MPDEIPGVRQRTRLHQINWPLWIGTLLVAIVVAFALFGPRLALHDPLEQRLIIRVGDQWISGPFAPFQTSQFPLGTDQLGRDIYSQLLYAVRPTLIMVVLVAAIRLVLGLVMGMVSGWTSGRIGRYLDVVISVALSTPALIVALAVVAGISTQIGIWAFILGLSANGWAESARLVRQQTRHIRTQSYIEAARAMGSSTRELVAGHVLRQIWPMVWMLLAFEVGGTLLTAAGLGFLGYYTNEVWVMITDTSAQRYSGLPDLGMMLSTVSTDIYTGPWKMVAAGTMVFMMVLGFNLIGEGLRHRLVTLQAQSSGKLSLLLERLGFWIGDHLQPLSAIPARRRAFAAAMLLILSAGGALGFLYKNASRDRAVQPAISIPGGHLWASQRHDAQGTLFTTVQGPKQPEILWHFMDPSGFSGGPVVDSEGKLYIAGFSKTLYALERDGSERWRVSLSEEPVGSPALGPAGEVYVAGNQGGLAAFSPEGKLLWTLTGSTEGTGGPVVDQDGKIYFTLGGQVKAVSPSGQLLWLEQVVPRRMVQSPVLDAAGRLVFLRSSFLQTLDGKVVQTNSLPPADQYLIGGDGQAYSRFENYLTPVTIDPVQASAGKRIEWDYQNYAWGWVKDLGVTGSGLIWMLYGSELEDFRLVWLAKQGTVLGFQRFPLRLPGQVIAIDGKDVAHICGRRLGLPSECRAYVAGSEKPLWIVPLPTGGAVTGGALVDGRLYVALADRMLYALGD